MPRPKRKTTVLAPASNGALATRSARPEKKLIPDDAWVRALLIDAEQKQTSAGADAVALTFEVLNPRLYAGTYLYLLLHPALDKTLGALAGDNAPDDPGFPGVNFLDADEVWQNCGGQVMRVHVAVELPYTDEVTGTRYDARNRVMSFRAQTERVAK